MKIALLGYGKMGKIIEEIAISRGHSVVLKVNSANSATFSDTELQQADVAIEFSRPDSVMGNIERCMNADVPVVVGTTGWYAQLENVKSAVQHRNGALFYASNFSLGVNLFFKMNEQLADLMKPFAEYEPSIEEIHHIHKLDAPSGTGITLADGLISHLGRKKNWKLYTEKGPETANENDVPLIAIRTGEVPGTHTVTYTSVIDRISMTHEAFNRKGFATGSVIAAEWITKRKGVYTMRDLLGY
jgi:4-hydroxy-tetrahydrodipicolinate reductase